jgi:GT2 family glycosyltransferase
MAFNPHFSVIIVNYNGGDYLKGALASLAAQTRQDFEVFLVDNASTDGSMERLGDKLPEHLHLMPQTENLGFAAANNLAAKSAKGAWLVLLNPDAEAAPNWLEKLAEAATRFPATKSFASAQIDLNNPENMDGAGDAYLGFGIPWRGGFGRPVSEMPGEGECFSPCGAGAMIHRETFLAHGGFDERFFCFCEDVDLGYRMRLAGERCIFLPDAIIHHAGGGLSGRVSEFSLFHGARNRLWTYFKNTPLRLLVLTLPVHIALTAAILLRGLVTGRFGGTWRGLWAGIKGLRPILRERKALKTARKTSISAICAAMCWNPFTMLRRKPHITPIKPEKTS